MHRSGWRVNRVRDPAVGIGSSATEATEPRAATQFSETTSAGLLNQCPRGKADPFSVTQVQNDHLHMTEMAVETRAEFTQRWRFQPGLQAAGRHSDVIMAQAGVLVLRGKPGVSPRGNETEHKS